MSQRTSIFFAIVLFLLSYNSSFALQLEVTPELIEFTKDAKPITIELRVFDGNKPIRWDSKKLRGLSSDINIFNLNGESLGRNSISGIKFMPIGSADGLNYRLVGVVDRSIINNMDFKIVISIADNTDLTKVLPVVIPELKNQSLEEVDTKLSDVDKLLKSLQEIKKDTDRTLYWIGGLGLAVLLTMFGLLWQIFSLRKSDEVTKDVSRNIELLQEQESSSIKEQHRESHNELFKQGMTILSSTSSVHERTHELIRVTEKIDNGIRGMASGNDNSQVTQDFQRLKHLIVDIADSSKKNSDDLSGWVSKIENDRESLTTVMGEISDSVHFFSHKSELFIDRLEHYDKVIDRLYNFGITLEQTNDEAEINRLRRLLDQEFEEMKRESEYY